MIRWARPALLTVAAAVACLAVLWASVTAGVWLALHTVSGDVGPRPTLALTITGLVVMAWLLARAVGLLVADLRDPEMDR